MHSQLTALFLLVALGLGSISVLGSPDSSAALRGHHVGKHIHRSSHPHIKKRNKKTHCASRPANVTVNAVPTTAPATTSQATTAPTTTSTPAAASTDNSQAASGSQDSKDGGGGDWEFTGGDVTYYGIGLGACGWVNTEPDLIAAVSFLLYQKYAVTAAEKGNPNLNPLCGRKATANLPGIGTVNFTIADECMGCDIETSLDFSMAAFDLIAPGLRSKGRLHGMRWRFIDE